MAQLQSAMAASMTSKSAEPEHVKPGISELPRLPELSETSCIDVGDWLHALHVSYGGPEQFLGSLVAGGVTLS